MTDGGWVANGKVRARETGRALVLSIDGLTTQARYYKPLMHTAPG